MSLDLLTLLRQAFDPAIGRQAAAHLSEPQPTLRAGIDTIIPVTLAGFLHQIDSGEAASLIALAKDAMNRTHFLDLAGQFSDHGGGVPAGAPAAITGVFGERFGAIANAVTSHTGMKGASTSAVFGAVVPYALARLGRYVQEHNVAPGALGALFAPSRSTILAALPVGLNLAGLRDVKPLPATPVVAATPAPEKRSNWLPLLLAGLALAALLWFFLRGRSGQVAGGPVAAVDTVVQVQTDTVTGVRAPKKVVLVNGVEIDATMGGIEDLLIAFLNDPNAKPGADNWFDFNDLNFEFGTARILPESRRELDNLVQILKAYPKVKVKLGGYTDRVGDPAANMKLSLERASAVASALREAGLAGQVVGAEGYGSEFAKFPESAPEADRVKDRRVSVSVREK